MWFNNAFGQMSEGQGDDACTDTKDRTGDCSLPLYLRRIDAVGCSWVLGLRPGLLVVLSAITFSEVA